MGMWDMVRMMRRAGRIAEAAPAPPASAVAEAADLPAVLSGSVQVRHVDAGSCNGCEIEIGMAFGPTYDAERYGARLVASPRHADALLVTGVVTQNMAAAVKRTYEATPRPNVVLAVGDCARDCGVFARAYGVAGSVSDVIPVDIEVPGCPPHPADITAALRLVTDR